MERKKKFLLIAGILLALLLAAALTVSLIHAAEERARLEREWEECDKRPTQSTAPQRPASMTGLQLIASRYGYLARPYYFGDDTLYGRGLAEEPGKSAESYRTMLKSALTDEVGRQVQGRFYDSAYTGVDTFTPSLSLLSRDILYFRSMEFRLLLLTPTARTAEAGAAGDGGAYTGEFMQDLETLLREVRTALPLCDIVLTVPHDATAETAGTMAALAAHYGLILVDMREAFRGREGLVHTEGKDLGYPTEQGHRAYADTILAAVLTAADEGHTMKECPSERLIEERNP